MADDDTLAQNNVVMSDPQDALAGGPRTYNPALGMLLVRNPEAAAALLASRGAPIPKDASPDITHRDAAQGLGAALDPSNLGTPQTSSLRLPPTGASVSGFHTPTATALPGINPYTPPEQTAGTMDIPPIGLSLPPPPSGYHRSSQDVSGPTPSGDSPNQTGAAVPAPATSEKPGDLSKPDPVPSGMRMTRTPDASPSVHPDKTVDGLSKALAGLQALTPKPFLPSTPSPYHATNPISRSTLPQQLMAEILGAAKPTAQFRLGEALRGKSYA